MGAAPLGRVRTIVRDGRFPQLLTDQPMTVHGSTTTNGSGGVNGSFPISLAPEPPSGFSGLHHQHVRMT
jgi:hypothetical protein